MQIMVGGPAPPLPTPPFPTLARRRTHQRLVSKLTARPWNDRNGDQAATPVPDECVTGSVREQKPRDRARTAARVLLVRETSSDAVGSSAAGTAPTRQHSLPRGGRLLVRASGSQRVCWWTYDRSAELAVWSCRARRSVAARAARFWRPSG